MTILRVAAPTFTRPNDTTTYGAGDLVANNTAAASVVALNWQFPRDALPKRQLLIRSAVSNVSGAGAIANKSIRVHLFTAVPTFTSAGDNSAISTVVATGYANWIGSLDIPAHKLIADGSFGIGGPTSVTTSPVSEIVWEATVAPDAGGNLNLYGFLEATGGYQPAAQETYRITLCGIPVVD